MRYLVPRHEVKKKDGLFSYRDTLLCSLVEEVDYVIKLKVKSLFNEPI